MSNMNEKSSGEGEGRGGTGFLTHQNHQNFREPLLHPIATPGVNQHPIWVIRSFLHQISFVWTLASYLHEVRKGVTPHQIPTDVA